MNSELLKNRHNYLLVLMILQAFTFAERFALGVVLQDVKIDLSLSDLQLGVLSGIAFAVFYSTMGLPIARWTDRGNRVVLITMTFGLWSVAVAACGFAQNFTQLLLIRVNVAVGEAGGYIPAFSLLADYYNRSERPKAMATYALGGCLSLIASYLLAGWLAEVYGWRIIFVLIGLPGIGLAILAATILREPRKLELRSTAAVDPIGRVTRTLFNNSTFTKLVLALSVQFFFMFGILQWQPVFFIRSYHLTTSAVGLAFAAVYGVGSLVGTYLGGAAATRLAPSDERLQLLGMSAAMALSTLICTGIYLSTNLVLSLTLTGLLMLTQTALNGPLYATIQALIPERMRGMAVALALFFANLVGMGFGPLAVGALSDAFAASAGDESVRYALLILSPGLLIAAAFTWSAGRSVNNDLDRAAVNACDQSAERVVTR